MALADNTASGVCFAPSCFLAGFVVAAFLDDGSPEVPESGPEDADEVADERSEAEDKDMDGFLESPLIVADESDDGTWTSDAGREVGLVRTSDFTVEVGGGDADAESDVDESDSLLSDPVAG